LLFVAIHIPYLSETMKNTDIKRHKYTTHKRIIKSMRRREIEYLYRYKERPVGHSANLAFVPVE